MNDSQMLVEFPAPVLEALRNALARERSAGEAAVLAREIGAESAPAFLAALDSSSGAENGGGLAEIGSERFWDRLRAFFSDAGWGELQHDPMHPGVGSLVAPDWAEARATGGATQPACHFTTGLISGLLTRVAGVEVAAMEVECRARGDSHCRFTFGGLQTLEEVYRHIREGHEPTTAVARLG